MKTIQIQETISPWLVMTNSWLRIGAFLPVFRRPGIFFCDKTERKERKERRLLGPRLSMPFDLLPDCFRCGLDWVGWDNKRVHEQKMWFLINVDCKDWKPCEIEKCVALLLHKNWAMMVKNEFLKNPLRARKLFGSFETVLRKCTPGWRKNSRLNNHSVLKYKELRFCQIRSRIGLGKSYTVRTENSFIGEGSIAERSAFYLQLSAFNLPPSPYKPLVNEHLSLFRWMCFVPGGYVPPQR